MKDSLRHGLGVCTWCDGSWYKGFWKDDNMDGFGVLDSPNSNRYEGDFVMNMKEGTGINYFNVDILFIVRIKLFKQVNF